MKKINLDCQGVHRSLAAMFRFRESPVPNRNDFKIYTNGETHQVMQLVTVGCLWRKRKEWMPCGFHILDGGFFYYNFKTAAEAQAAINYTCTERSWKEVV